MVARCTHVSGVLAGCLGVWNSGRHLWNRVSTIPVEVLLIKRRLVNAELAWQVVVKMADIQFFESSEIVKLGKGLSWPRLAVLRSRHGRGSFKRQLTDWPVLHHAQCAPWNS